MMGLAWHDALVRAQVTAASQCPFSDARYRNDAP
jgi:hypothetical protein